MGDENILIYIRLYLYEWWELFIFEVYTSALVEILVYQ